MKVRYLGDADQPELEVVDESARYYIVKVPRPTERYPFTEDLEPVLKTDYSPSEPPMKVRHKISKIFREVLREDGEYYVFMSEVLCQKSDYEPLPTDHWQDVTACCEVEGKWLLQAHLRKVAHIDCEDRGYRFRKVSLNELIVSNRNEGCASNETVAFIVERKVSE